MQTVKNFVIESINKRYVKETIQQRVISSSIAHKGLIYGPNGKYDNVYSIISDNMDAYNDLDKYINFIERDRSGRDGYNEVARSYISIGYNGSLDFLDLCSVLDIDVQKVAKNILAYKHISENAKAIGYGGMVANIFQFSSLFHNYIRITNVKDFNRDQMLNSVFNVAYDYDSLEFHNLPRIYDLYRYINYNSKMKGSFCYNKFLKVDSSNNRVRIDENTYKRLIDSFVFGAMDIETRAILCKKNVPFLATLHNGDDCFMVENQTVNGIEVESYGKIDIPIFLLNVLKLTENLIVERLPVSPKDYGIDKTVFQFNARKFIEKKYSEVTKKTRELVMDKFKSGDFPYSPNMSESKVKSVCDKLVAFKLNGKIHVIF